MWQRSSAVLRATRSRKATQSYHQALPLTMLCGLCPSAGGHPVWLRSSLGLLWELDLPSWPPLTQRSLESLPVPATVIHTQGSNHQATLACLPPVPLPGQWLPAPALLARSPLLSASLPAAFLPGTPPWQTGKLSRDLPHKFIRALRGTSDHTT